MVDTWTKAAAEEFFDELRRLAVAAEKFAVAAEKTAELMGAAVSQLDEIRAEVTKMNEPADEDSEPPVLSGPCRQANHETCEGSYFQMRSGDSPDEFHCECHCHIERLIERKS